MKELWFDRKKRNLIIQSCIVFLLIAHSYRWMNTMYSHDSLLIIQTDRVWQISLGRIWNPLYVWLRGRILAPVNIALFSAVFLILSSAVVIRTLRLEKDSSVVFCCGFLTTFETVVFVNAVFLLSLDLDMLALLFSVLAAYLFMGKKSLLRYAAGVLSVTAMLGLFQSYAEVTILLTCLVMLKDVLEGGSPKQIFLKGLRSAGLFILGGILYYICLKAVTKITGVAPADTVNGLVKMKRLTVPDAITLAKEAWVFSLRYLFANSFISHRDISVWIYRILALFSLSGIAWIACRKRLGPAAAALIIFLLLFMPLGGNCVYVLSLRLKHSLMNYSFVFYSILFVMIFDMLRKEGGILNYVRLCFPLLFGVLLLNHVLFANQWYTRNDLYSKAGISFINRLITDMEEADGYETGKTPVLILGHIDYSPASFYNEKLEIFQDYNIGTLHRLAISYYETYREIFENVMGYPVNIVPLSEVSGYLNDPQIQAMPIYPARGSVQMINGTLVIRLSEDLRPEDLRWK